MIDIDARGRDEARRLREEAARMADTERALRSVLDGEVVVPLQTDDPAQPRTDESDAVISVTSSAAESTSGRRWPILIAAAAVVLVVGALGARDPRRRERTPSWGYSAGRPCRGRMA